MKRALCGERGSDRMNHSEMMLNEPENCPVQKQRTTSVWLESVYYLIYTHTSESLATT